MEPIGWWWWPNAIKWWNKSGAVSISEKWRRRAWRGEWWSERRRTVGGEAGVTDVVQFIVDG